MDQMHRAQTASRADLGSETFAAGSSNVSEYRLASHIGQGPADDALRILRTHCGLDLADLPQLVVRS